MSNTTRSFGRNNPNSKRNLAFLGIHSRNSQPPATTPATMPYTPPPTPVGYELPPLPPQQFNDVINAISCAYNNGCFGSVNPNAYYIFMEILQKIAMQYSHGWGMNIDNARSTMLYSGMNVFMNRQSIGALWANVPPNQKNMIIQGIQCGYYQYGCISQTAFMYLQGVLSQLNSYSGPHQTYASVLDNGYSVCMANAQPNQQSYCNILNEISTGISNELNYLADIY